GRDALAAALAALTPVPVAALTTAPLAAVPLATIPVPARAAVPAAGTALRCRRPLGTDLVEVHLAPAVDLGDLDLNLVADVEVVLHPIDALAVADLGDVQQAVPAGQERDEGAERRRLHHSAEEPVANLRHRRVGDRVDAVDRGLGRDPIGRPDVDRAVVLNGDLRAGLILDRVDGLALRADHHADLVDRDLHGG